MYQHQNQEYTHSTAFGVPKLHRLSSESSNSLGKRVNSSFFFVRSRYLEDT